MECIQNKYCFVRWEDQKGNPRQRRMDDLSLMSKLTKTHPPPSFAQDNFLNKTQIASVFAYHPLKHFPYYQEWGQGFLWGFLQQWRVPPLNTFTWWGNSAFKVLSSLWLLCHKTIYSWVKVLLSLIVNKDLPFWWILFLQSLLFWEMQQMGSACSFVHLTDKVDQWFSFEICSIIYTYRLHCGSLCRSPPTKMWVTCPIVLLESYISSAVQRDTVILWCIVSLPVFR